MAYFLIDFLSDAAATAKRDRRTEPRRREKHGAKKKNVDPKIV